MDPINTLKTTLSLVALLTVALAAHANPRGVESKQKDQDAEVSPGAFEIPVPLLSTENLKLESAPVISFDEIEAADGFDDPLIIEDPMAEQPAPEPNGERWGNNEDDWRNDTVDMGIEAPDLELRQDLRDDLKIQEALPRIEIEVPAPAITLDF